MDLRDNQPVRAVEAEDKDKGKIFMFYCICILYVCMCRCKSFKCIRFQAKILVNISFQEVEKMVNLCFRWSLIQVMFYGFEGFAS